MELKDIGGLDKALFKEYVAITDNNQVFAALYSSINEQADKADIKPLELLRKMFRVNEWDKIKHLGVAENGKIVEVIEV
jgi:hypothetical protein